MCGFECNCATPCPQCSCKKEEESFIVESRSILDSYHIPGCLCGGSHRYGNALFVRVEKPEVGHKLASMLPSGSSMVEHQGIGESVLLVGSCDEQHCIGALRALHTTICSNGGLINRKLIDGILTDWIEEIQTFDSRARERLEALDFEKELCCADHETKEYFRINHSVLVKI